MRLASLFKLGATLTFVIGAASTALAQSPEPEQEPQTRQTIIGSAAAEKAKDLHPYELTKAEKVVMKIERRFTNQTVRWHPYLQPAYRGGGFAPGLGYMFHTSSYSTLDARELQHQVVQPPRPSSSRRACSTGGIATVLGGWRDAEGHLRVGMNTSTGDLMNYRFKQPSGSALTVGRRRLLWCGVASRRRGGTRLVKATRRPR